MYKAEEKLSKQKAKQLFESMLKANIQKVIDWNQVDKESYLSAMERSVVKDVEIKHLLHAALTDKIHDRETFMKGIDVSYYYEGYSEFRIEDV